MAEQQRIQKPAPAPQADVQPMAQAPEAADLSATDDLLDEIDAILEENAEEFVRDYIQKGGE
jgi:ubiquitin-like protein Pup